MKPKRTKIFEFPVGRTIAAVSTTNEVITAAELKHAKNAALGLLEQIEQAILAADEEG